MKRVHGLVVSLAFLCVMLLSLVGRAEEKTALDFAKWAPERPAGVVVVDLQALKIKAEYAKFKEYVKEFLPQTLTGPNELTDALAQFESGLDVFESQLDKFRAVGAAKAYLFIDSRDYDNPSSIILVIPTDAAKSNQAQKLAVEFVKGDFIPESGRAEWQKAFFVKAYEDCIVLAPNLKNDDLDEERQKQFFAELEHRNSALSNKPFQIWFSKASSWKTGEIQVYLFPEGELAKVLEKADRALAAEGVAPNTIIKGIRAAAIEFDFAKSDLRLQIISEDDQSANELYSAMPVVKRAVLNRKDGLLDSLEKRLAFSDVFNHSIHLFNPVVKYNTLNWSSKAVFKRLDALLPKITIDRSAGLYAPVTQSVKEEADRIYSLAAPFINKQTFAVIHLDTADLDGAFGKAGAKVYDELKRLLPGTFNANLENITQAVNYIQMVLEDIDRVCRQIKAVGGRDLFVIVDNDTAASVKLIVPFDKEKKADAKKLFYFLREMRFLSPRFVEEQESLYFRSIYKNCLVFGIKNSNLPVSKDDFNNSLKEFEAQDVPEIRQAFELSWSYQRSDKNSIALSRFQAILNVQALLKAINAPVLQLLRERLEDDDPELAKLLPAFTDRQLADGVKTAVLEIHPEKLFVNLHVISKDEQSARDFAQFVKAFKPLVAQSYLNSAPEDAPAFARDLTLDYVDSIFDSRVLEVRDNVLSIRSNNYSEKYKKLNSWVSENCSMTAIGAAGVAVGLLLPAVASARESARRMQNANNFKQLALGMLMYEAAHRYLPLPYTKNADDKRLHSWRVALLPYLGEPELYDQIRLDEPWDSEWNKQFHDKCPKVYKNPNVELAPNETTFAVVVGENTVFPGSKKLNMASIMDGCCNTALIVERSPVCWMDPNSDIPLEEAIKGVNVSPNGIRSCFNGFFSAAMCDASVRSLPDNVSSVFLRKLFERNDGKIIELDDPELNE